MLACRSLCNSLVFSNNCKLVKNLISTSNRFQSTSSNVKIAVIGSGPAGFYTTQALLKNPNVNVDIYEKAPVPFGLVRFGVAPDHPEVKNVISSFTKVADNERVTFNGNVAIGSQITLQQLRAAYNVVVLCYGSTEDRLLGIEGEQLPCVIPARRFVGWYNGVQDDKDLEFDLNCERVAIIGQGNVALDCARILLSSVDTHLQNTDITEYALEKLKSSKVKRVHMIGRRGPLQAAFKTKELREMSKLQDFRLHIDLEMLQSCLPSDLSQLPRSRRRLTELMLQIASKNRQRTNSSDDKVCTLEFLQSPIGIVRENNRNILKLRRNSINESEKFTENASVTPTDQTRDFEFDLLIRSIGYRAVSIDPAIPMNEKSGVIENEQGRISRLGKGMYCSGWAATGATGVIVGTMTSSFEIGDNILRDIQNGQIDSEPKPGRDEIVRQLKQENVKIVSFDDWKKIDRLEQDRGRNKNKPREKFVNTDEILKSI